MKFCYVLFLLLLVNNLKAQSAVSWDGSFEGSILGLPAVLTCHTTNSNWSGAIDVNGYLLNIQGRNKDLQSVGTMSDPQAGTSVPYSAILNGQQIILKIEDINPATGHMEQMEFPFTRIDPKEVIRSGSSNIIADKTSHDENLPGTWRYTETYVSGEFSFATDWFMWINADGTFQYSEGRTAGGGPEVSADSGNGKVGTAKWKTENKSIYIDEGDGWQFYAKYYYENNSLMLTFASGKKQVWSKL